MLNSPSAEDGLFMNFNKAFHRRGNAVGGKNAVGNAVGGGGRKGGWRGISESVAKGGGWGAVGGAGDERGGPARKLCW
jgi:hypothetical protein